MSKRLVVMFVVFLAAAGITAATAGAAWQGQGRGPQGGPPFRGPGGPGGPGGPEGRFFHDLDLSDEQKEQIKKLHEAERASAQTYFEQSRQIREELRAATEAGAFDEAAVRAIATKSAAIEVELTVLRVKTQAAIYNLLTEEQKAKLAERRANMPRRPERTN